MDDDFLEMQYEDNNGSLFDESWDADVFDFSEYADDWDDLEEM